ncbi:MAG: nucleolar RNA-binding Nop10p family protein [Candidatus Thorarchaeota archaeon]
MKPLTHLFKCTVCHEYTLEEDRCPRCSGSVASPYPAKFSLQDKYGEYRRRAKRKLRMSAD